MGLAFINCLLKVNEMFGTVNPCFLFLKDKMHFYFRDLFIVMISCDLFYPSNRSGGKCSDIAGGFLVWSVATVILLIQEKKKHTKKKPINMFEKSVYVWCWFVMFASESSHASSFKNFWICASQKPQPSKKCTTR